MNDQSRIFFFLTMNYIYFKKERKEGQTKRKLKLKLTITKLREYIIGNISLHIVADQGHAALKFTTKKMSFNIALLTSVI